MAHLDAHIRAYPTHVMVTFVWYGPQLNPTDIQTPNGEPIQLATEHHHTLDSAYESAHSYINSATELGDTHLLIEHFPSKASHQVEHPTGQPTTPDALITAIVNATDADTAYMIAMQCTPTVLRITADQLYVTPDSEHPRKATLARAIVNEARA